VRLLRRFFNLLLGVLLTPLILFEEWGWDALQALAARLARWGPLKRLERRIAALPPYAALALMLLPSLAIVPVKLLAVWLLARGRVVSSLVLVVLSKVVGTAALAHLFALTKPALMRLAWFASAYTRWVAWKGEWLARARATAVWRAVHGVARRVAQQLRRAWRRG